MAAETIMGLYSQVYNSQPFAFIVPMLSNISILNSVQLALSSEILVALCGNIDLRVNYWQIKQRENKKGNKKKKNQPHLASTKPELNSESEK